MGIDLVGAGLAYNWAGWRWLVAKLQSWGVDTSEFTFSNDGAQLSAETCRRVAGAIADHLDELAPEEHDWLGPHVERWKTCRGCEQW